MLQFRRIQLKNPWRILSQIMQLASFPIKKNRFSRRAWRPSLDATPSGLPSAVQTGSSHDLCFNFGSSSFRVEFDRFPVRSCIPPRHSGGGRNPV